MKSSKLKKLCAVIMAATISTTLFIGCGSSNDGSTQAKVIVMPVIQLNRN